MSAQSLIDDVKKHAIWSIVMGVLTAALGVFLTVYPLVTAKITTALLGWALIFVGITQLVFALHSQKTGGVFLKLVAAALFAVTGAGLAFAPMESVEALTGLLGTLLLVQAGLATVAAFQIRPLAGWAWSLIDGGASFLLGTLIMLKWPSSSVWAIGTLVGVSVLMSGIARIIVAAKIRDGVCSVERSLRTAA
jgi:uncharacterized membrane protein HdeD (DUF308 family)